MGLIKQEDRFWRTDFHKQGRSIYALKSNDIDLPSSDDPLIGVMETTQLAEDVVDLHNNAIKMYGRHFRRVMAADA